MQQLLFMNFSGVAGYNRGYTGWTNEKWDDCFVPDSPFFGMYASHGQSAIAPIQVKYAEIKAALQTGDTEVLSGVTNLFGLPMTYETCPLNLTDSALLSMHNRRYDFSAAVSYASDSIPAIMTSSKGIRQRTLTDGSHYSLSGGANITATGSSSTYKFPHRLLEIGYDTVLAPQVIEQPDEVSYGEGYEIGMRIASTITGGA